MFSDGFKKETLVLNGLMSEIYSAFTVKTIFTEVAFESCKFYISI